MDQLKDRNGQVYSSKKVIIIIIIVVVTTIIIRLWYCITSYTALKQQPCMIDDHLCNDDRYSFNVYRYTYSTT